MPAVMGNYASRARFLAEILPAVFRWALLGGLTAGQGGGSSYLGCVVSRAESGHGGEGEVGLRAAMLTGATFW